MAGTFLNEALEHENDIESWLGDLNRMKEEGKTETLIFFGFALATTEQPLEYARVNGLMQIYFKKLELAYRYHIQKVLLLLKSIRTSH